MKFTESKLTAAIEIARRKVNGNAARTRGVEKAASALLNGEIIVTVLVNGGIVTSANGTYHIQRGFCSCPAALNGCAHCYHVSALRIATIADELETAPAVTVRRPTITRSIERNHNGPRLRCVRVDGWLV